MSQGLVLEVVQNGQAALWVTDGTAGGTVLLVQTNRTAIDPIGNLGDLLVFYGDNAEPWVTDGTAAGTRELSDANPGLVGSFPQLLGIEGAALLHCFTGDFATQTRNPTGREAVELGGKLVFTAYNPATGFELCAYDPAGGDSYLLRDIKVEAFPDGSYPRGFTLIGNKAVFGASDDATGSTDLWVTDGTVAGNFKLRDGFGPTYLSSLGNKVVYIDRDPANGAANALFVTDGTVAGTQVLQGGLAQDFVHDAEVVGGLAFFSINATAPQGDLWVTDGTGGLTKVADYSNGPGSARPSQLTAFDGRLFYFADPDGSGYRLYASDGTAAGTVVIAATGAPVAPMAVVGQKLIFFVGVGGQTQIWQTYGTSAGTARILDPIGAGLPYNPQLYGVIGSGSIDGTPGADTLTGTAAMTRSTALRARTSSTVAAGPTA